MRVLIGIPVHPELGVSPLFVRFLNQALSTLASNGIQVDYLFMTTPSIESARESIVNALLDPSTPFREIPIATLELPRSAPKSHESFYSL